MRYENTAFHDFLVFGHIAVQAQSQFLLTGKITHHNGRSLLYCNGQKLQIKADGSFSEKIRIRRSFEGYTDIYFGTDKIVVFAEPEDSLFISWDQNNPLTSLLISGKYPANHQFEQLFALKYQAVLENMVQDSLMPPDVFSRYADRLLESQLKYWSDFIGTYPVSARYKAFKEADMYYRIAYEKLQKPFRYVAKTKKSRNITQPDYYQFLSSTTIQNEAAIGSKAYQLFLDAYLRYQSGEKVTLLTANAAQAGLQYYDQAVSQLNGLPLEYALANSLIRIFDERLYDQRTLSRLERYRALASETKWLEQVQSAYENNKRLLKDAPAPELSLLDIRNIPKSVQEYNGKIIYITFWDEQCPDCLMYLDSAFQKFRRNFKDEVILYNVYMGQNETTWKTLIKNHQIQGINVRNREYKEKNATLQYNVRSTPSFF